MRKRDPNDVITAFQVSATASLDNWSSMLEALADRPLDLRRRLSVDAFLRLAVRWESFRSEWHIAAINRDATRFRADLEQRFRQSVGDRFPGLEPFVRVELPLHPPLQTIEEILDPARRNISFGADWVKRAERELATDYASTVGALGLPDLKLVIATEKIRNCLVHESPYASQQMNAALMALEVTVDDDLMRGARTIRPSGIATYLHAEAGGRRRVARFHERLDEIAEKLRTSASRLH
jgi:hypothetical protein